ncbi:FR47-like protein [Paraburkholderia sp. BL23I1N1]|uniref:GNAT family N-acetyltransferase n=1 Tax=Paraburkholderia sp. BL23I1N1 TaxID=1938802 RepID=UPI000E76B34A|nr:GNAT family N-acetyltransferase [Paraburkholderia sp. BL23I1N1]RKE38262.1 FR47-like protein [Paraburkholderia sp. BL23I1N1]
MQSSHIDAASEIATEEYLANPVWIALSEAPLSFVERREGGARYRPEFAPFGAAQNYSAQSVSQVAAMLQPGQRLSFFTAAKPNLPSGFDVVREAVANQMVAANRFTVSSDERIVRLGVDDTPDMLRLAELTEPGPFNARTNELGHFFGIREGGQLVAMAGERMTAGKYVEISAVCTHPEWRGRGLGRLLMDHLSATIQERDRVPFLHVFTNNLSAVRLYRELGFRIARTLQLTAIVRSSGDVS